MVIIRKRELTLIQKYLIKRKVIIVCCDSNGIRFGRESHVINLLMDPTKRSGLKGIGFDSF